MIKMYQAEVLSKFPVVQHFPFGSLFRWHQDPYHTTAQEASIHLASQPMKGHIGPLSIGRKPTPKLARSGINAPPIESGTGLPNATNSTQAPWANKSARLLTSSDPISVQDVEGRGPHGTKKKHSSSKAVNAAENDSASLLSPATKAPWAS